MKYGICNLATTPIRSQASDESEIVSQLVFGDFVQILSIDKPWIKIKNNFDGYVGWMDFKQLIYISQKDYLNGTTTNHPVVANKTLNLTGPHGSLTIFSGASLPFLTDQKLSLGDETYVLNEPLLKVDVNHIEKLCLDYLNAPYLWGGKSVYGIDCSGFTQNIFKILGINIPRDASEQVLIGEDIQWENRKKNDVVFYTTSSNKVTHVGILISGNEVIHAHGRVRIDKSDKKGIYNIEQEKYTHNYHSLKRWI